MRARAARLSRRAALTSVAAKENRHGRHPLHQRPHLRRRRRGAVHGRGARPGRQDRARRPQRQRRSRGAGRRRARRRRRRRLPDAGDGRGAHPFLVERPADARRDPAHAARRAHPLVRRGREEVPRHGLDQLRRRRGGQAAPRRRHQERDQRRHHRRPALPRREPGDHGAGRPRRHDPAAPAAARLRVRRDRQRRGGDAALRPHVRQVGRRLAQDQPLGRVDHRHAERPLPVHRRRDRRPASRRPRPGASGSRRTRARATRSSAASRTASR